MLYVGREEFWEEYFHYFQENGSIKGDIEYKKRTEHDPNEMSHPESK
jgi:hypothetical protein